MSLMLFGQKHFKFIVQDFPQATEEKSDKLRKLSDRDDTITNKISFNSVGTKQRNWEDLSSKKLA